MWKHKNFINLQLCAGETWVLNETVALPSGNMSADFQSNNRYFATIGTGIMYSKNYLSYIDEYNDDTFVYRENTNTWVNQDGTDTTAYRTLIFDTSPTGDLLTWLQANGTKQSAPTPTLTFKHFYDAGTIGTGTYKFRHYSQTEPSTGETWVLNYPTDSAEIINVSVQFTSNGKTYSLLETQKSSGGRAWYKIYYDTTEVYSFMVGSGDYTDEAYRTITFATPPTGDLLTWLQANGTKQGGAVTLISFSVSGTSYQAEEGMTWQQWINSSYNTDDFVVTSDGTISKQGNGNIYVDYSASTTVSTSDTIIAEHDYYNSGSGSVGP